MKTILAPTDFSDASRNAVAFAMALAKRLQASLILYNAYHIPVIVNEMPVMAFAPEELEKTSLRHLQDYRDQILDTASDDIRVECITTPGFAVDEIGEQALEKNIDLIVMAISGAGSVGQVLLGSVTTGVLKNSHKPLLIVPEKAVFSGFRRIAFAYDGELEIGPAVLRQLNEFTGLFGAELLVIIVEKTIAGSEEKKAEHTMRLQKHFSGIRHTLYFSESKDVTEGIEAFNQDHQVDLLIMVPRQHSFFERIFTRSNTTKMAYHTHIPILALHE